MQIILLFAFFVACSPSNNKGNLLDDKLTDSDYMLSRKRDSILNLRCKAIVNEELKRGNLLGYDDLKHGGRFYDDVLLDFFGVNLFPYKPDFDIVAKQLMDSVIFKKYSFDVYKVAALMADTLSRIYSGVVDYRGDYCNADDYIYASFKNTRGIDTMDSVNGYSLYFTHIVDSVLKSENLIYKKTIPWPCDVILRSQIDEKGRMCNLRIVKKLRPDIDARVLRIFEEFPYNWQPATYKGKKVKEWVTLTLECPTTKLIYYPKGWQGEAKPK